MNYRTTFDQLGNPIARAQRVPLWHRAFQITGLAAIAVLLVLLGGGK